MARTARNHTVRRALALTLSFVMLWGGVPAPALAQMSEEVVVEEGGPDEGQMVVVQEDPAQVPAPDENAQDDDELVVELPQTIVGSVSSPEGSEQTEDLLNGYVQQMLDDAIPDSDDSTDDFAFSTQSAGDHLANADAKLYNALKNLAQQAARGEIAKTEVTIACSELQSDYNFGPWTTADLGVSTLVQDGQLTEAASDAIWRRMPFNLSGTIGSLLADCPYDLFWYDKTAGTAMSMTGISTESVSGEVVSVNLSKASIKYMMLVAPEYALNNASKTTSLNKEMISDINSSVQHAVTKAQSIVNANSAKTKYERLKAYNDAICDEVGYNYDAAGSASTPYGNPWQLIWVFDGDSSTNVVCEGYSKAFKYLCDLTWPNPAQSGIECLLASGMTTAGNGSGRHMWNIVRINGQSSYLVDVTNCDPTSQKDNQNTQGIGAPYELFMQYNEGGTHGSYADGYTFFPGGGSITYAYGETTKSAFTEPELTLATTAYADPHAKTPVAPPTAAQDLVYNGQSQTGVASGTGYTLSGTAQATNADTYTAIATLSDGYVWDDNSTDPRTITWSIARKPVTVTANNASKEYGENDPSSFSATVTGTVGNDAVTYTISRQRGDAVGTYTLTPSGATEQDNYTVSYVSGSFTITPASISGASITVANQTYAGADLTPAPTVTMGGTTLQPNTDYTCSYSNNRNAGTATVTVAGKGNYTGTKSKSFTIAKASLTVTANDKAITYGDAPANAGVTYSEFKGNDSALSLGGTLLYTYTYEQYGSVGNAYTITPSGLVSGNYDIAFVSGKLTVNPKPVTLAWSNTSFPYDGQPHVPTATASGIVHNDSVSVTVTGARTNVGTHTATAESLSNTNYCLPTSRTCTFTIGKGSIAPQVSLQGWTYGEAANTPSISGNPGNGTVTYTYGRQGDNAQPWTEVPTNAGDYVVRAKIAETDNYQSGTATANFSIAKAQSSVTAVPVAKALQYTSASLALVTAGTAAGGTMLYSLDNDSWSNQVPSVTNAGTYKVWYKVQGDANHTDTATGDPLSVTIAKAPNTLAVSGGASAVLGSSVNLSAFVQNAQGSVTYAIAGENTGCSVDANGTFTAGSRAGTYTVTVTASGNNNYEAGSKQLTVHVGGDLSQATIGLADAQSSFVYNGSQQMPELVVSIGDTTLTKDSDYTVTYGENKNAGSATATITAMANGDYVGSQVYTFQIAQKPVTVKADNKTKTYGDADPASFTATTSGILGEETVTYSVSRAEGENVGTYDITPLGEASQGNYSVTYEKGTFTITATSITGAQVSVPVQTYTGSALTPKPTVTCVGKTLTEGTDYMLSYGDNNTNVGTASVTITAKDGGNFTGTKTVDFQIAGKPVEVRAKDANKVFGSNDPVPFEATVTGTVGEDTVSYTVSRAEGENVGTYDITPSGDSAQGNYVVTYKPGTLTITSHPLKDAQLSSIAAQTYTGSALKPKPTVTCAGKTLQEGKDYTLSYANNINAGTATVTATGKGNYTGSKSTTFRINPAGITSVSLSQTSFTYDGSAKRPTVTVKAGSRTVPATGYNVSYANNVTVGTATVTVSGKGNYTGSKSATFRIVAPPAPAPAPTPAPAPQLPTPHVSYRTHVQRIGWQHYVSDGEMSGTSGRSFRLEGIKIRLSDLPCAGGIQYRTHVQRIGWQGWRRDDAMAGTKGKSYRLEAIEIKLYGEMANRYDVYYRVHCQRFGWMGWAKNGQRSGSAGYSRRLEGIQIVLMPKDQPGPGPTCNGITQRFAAPFKQKGKK